MAGNSQDAGPTPVVKPKDGADSTLVEIGQRYWKFNGFDDESGLPLWAEAASKINCGQWGEGAGRAFVVAAAAVRAILPDYTCLRCGGELSLTSRSALEKIILGEQLSSCVDCDESLQGKVARVLDPTRSRTARESRDRKTQQHIQQQRQQWRDQQQAFLEDTYSVVWLPDEPIPSASVKIETIALALLRYAPSPAPLEPVQQWIDPLYPNANDESGCLAGVLHAGLIRIHPSSSLNSFVWQPVTFEHALAEADDQGQTPTPALTDQYYARLATHYTPYGHSPETAATAVREHLTTRLMPKLMTFDRQRQLVELAVEVLAEETMRYLALLIEEHHLPPVPDNHQDRLTEAAYAAARVRSLAELYNLAWRAARAAAAAAQKNPQAPPANMTTHAVNRFESYTQQALDPAHPIKPFGPKSGLELAAVTRTLFLRVLQLDPFTTSVPDIEAALPKPASGPTTLDARHSQEPERQDEERRCRECAPSFIDMYAMASIGLQFLYAWASAQRPPRWASPTLPPGDWLFEVPPKAHAQHHELSLSLAASIFSEITIPPNDIADAVKVRFHELYDTMLEQFAHGEALVQDEQPTKPTVTPPPPGARPTRSKRSKKKRKH